MDRVYLQWSIVNWITVVLMAVLGYALLGVISQAIVAWKQPASAAS